MWNFWENFLKLIFQCSKPTSLFFKVKLIIIITIILHLESYFTSSNQEFLYQLQPGVFIPAPTRSFYTSSNQEFFTPSPTRSFSLKFDLQDSSKYPKSLFYVFGDCSKNSNYCQPHFPLLFHHSGKVQVIVEFFTFLFCGLLEWQILLDYNFFFESIA